ncbi:MAG: hypothetical protein A2521_01265 [Deltaproteobacteria bacterium RIFOXYD12_FULL_57_12]|nr:MAG: hypothetical protein A2521_01265 [Deltaproteobacteria bacterium RIFOXYD12_FULL_57_12]
MGELQFFTNTGQFGGFRGIHPVTKGQPRGFFRRVEFDEAILAVVAERPVGFDNVKYFSHI